MVLRECSTGGSSTINASGSTVYFEQGQGGNVVADGTMQDQPRFIVPTGQDISLTDVWVTFGQAANSQTTLQTSILNDTGDGSPPTPGSPSSTLNVASGIVYQRWTGLIGQTLTSMQHVQTRVDVAGNGAKDLTIHFLGEVV